MPKVVSTAYTGGIASLKPTGAAEHKDCPGTVES